MSLQITDAQEMYGNDCERANHTALYSAVKHTILLTLDGLSFLMAFGIDADLLLSASFR